MTVKIERAKPVAKKLKVLLYGPSGSHKTLSALSFPNALLVDAENGADLYPGHPDIPEFDVAHIKTIRELREICETVRADNGKTWGTLIVDPITIFYDTTKNLVSNNAEKDIDYRGWAKINNQMNSLYSLLIGLPVHVVIIAREAIEYAGSGNSLQKVGVKPDADKDLIYNMDMVIHMNMDASGDVVKSRGGALGDKGHLNTVGWADFEPISRLHMTGDSPVIISSEQAVELEADSLANPDVAKEFWAYWTNPKNGLTKVDIMTALGNINLLSEWSEGRAKADEAVKLYVDDMTNAKPATPKAAEAATDSHPNGSA
jgi:hypothetical protein